MKIFYTSVATATGDGRENGHVRSSDGVIDVEIAVPVELGGKGGADQSRAALRRWLLGLLSQRVAAGGQESRG